MMKTLRSANSHGYALVSIIVIGAFSMIFLMALATIVTNSTRAVSANKYIDSLRNAAETGIDYAVFQYNNSAATQYPCALDPSALDSSGKTLSHQTPLPAALLQSQSANSGSPNINVTITVKEFFAAADWQFLQSMSSVYSPQLDPNNTISTDWTHPATAQPLSFIDGTPVADGGYRIVESRADNGILSRTIRVILRARLDSQAPNLSTPSSSYFNSPMLSNQTLNIQPSGALSIQGFNSQNQVNNPMHTVTPTLQGQVSYTAYDLNVQTNQKLVLGTSGSNSSTAGTIVGDVTVANLATNQQIASTQNGTIAGRLTTSGTVDDPGSVAFTPNTAKPTTSPRADTVLANADLIANPLALTRVGQNYSAPVLENQSLQATTPAASPEPSSASSLNSLATISNAVPPVQPNGSPPPPPILTAGNYETQGLTTDGMTTPLIVQNNAGSPVKLFVDNQPSTPVNIDTSNLKFANPNTNLPANNADARNFQIFYEGSNPVIINVSSSSQPFIGLVYAPNAPVTISGNGTYSGAVVAGQLNVTMAGTMKLFTDLGSTTGGAGAANLSAGLLNSGTTATVQGWQPITWQEFTGVSF